MHRHDILIRTVLTAFAAILVCSSVAYGQTPIRYMIEELPTLEAHPNCPDTNSNATAINERGDVVGVAESSWD